MLYGLAAHAIAACRGGLLLLDERLTGAAAALARTPLTSAVAALRVAVVPGAATEHHLAGALGQRPANPRPRLDGLGPADAVARIQEIDTRLAPWTTGSPAVALGYVDTANQHLLRNTPRPDLLPRLVVLEALTVAAVIATDALRAVQANPPVRATDAPRPGQPDHEAAPDLPRLRPA